jgi:hypothetical protein
MTAEYSRSWIFLEEAFRIKAKQWTGKHEFRFELECERALN